MSIQPERVGAALNEAVKAVMAAAPTQGKFIRDSKGAIGWLRVSGRLHRRVAADEGDRPTQEDNKT